MIKKILIMVLMFALVATSVFASGEKESSKPASNDVAAPVVAVEDSVGFEEFPLGDDVELGGVINVAGVYFQPVDMEPVGLSGLPKDKASIHIEADISALEGNNLGFGKGDWVPYLTVDYKVINKSTNKVQTEGTFMPMSASDGPHYGANILLDKAGTYKVEFIIKSPENNGYLLHVDSETGVTGKFWKEPLVAVFDDWDYVPREW